MNLVSFAWAGYDEAYRVSEDITDSEPANNYYSRSRGSWEIGIIGDYDEARWRDQNVAITVTDSGVTYTLAYANYASYDNEISGNGSESGDFGIKYANGDIFAVYTSANLIDGGCPRPDVRKFGVGEGNITGSTAAKIRITYTETTAKVDFLEDGVTPANIFSGDCAAYNNWLEGD